MQLNVIAEWNWNATQFIMIIVSLFTSPRPSTTDTIYCTHHSQNLSSLSYRLGTGLVEPLLAYPQPSNFDPHHSIRTGQAHPPYSPQTALCTYRSRNPSQVGVLGRNFFVLPSSAIQKFIYAPQLVLLTP